MQSYLFFSLVAYITCFVSKKTLPNPKLQGFTSFFAGRHLIVIAPLLKKTIVSPLNYPGMLVKNLLSIDAWTLNLFLDSQFYYH